MIHSCLCLESGALISKVLLSVLTQNMHLFPSRSDSTCWSQSDAASHTETLRTQTQRRAPYLHAAVLVHLDDALTVPAVLSHEIRERAGLQTEPALRPVPAQVTLLPQIALRPDHNTYNTRQSFILFYFTFYLILTIHMYIYISMYHKTHTHTHTHTHTQKKYNINL